MNRRSFLVTSAFGLSVIALPRARAAGSAPKALVFDTFGTVVDWRGSIAAEGAEWGKAKGLKIDWAHFADRWRAGYGPSMEKVRKGQLPWTKLDDLHRMVLEDLLKEFQITGLTEDEKDHWNRVWHRLKPWPDSVAGLTRLKKKFIIAPLSNGNVSRLGFSLAGVAIGLRVFLNHAIQLPLYQGLGLRAQGLPISYGARSTSCPGPCPGSA